jgi:outer membrane protein assembly factor BamB
MKSLSLCVLCLTFLTGPESAAAADWPTFMHDRQRSGVTAERLNVPLNECWVYKARYRPQPAWPGPAKQDYWHRAFNLRATVTYDRAFHVVGVGDTIFFGSSGDDKVYALDARTGDERWTFFTEGPVRLAPSIADGKAYVGSDDGCVYCLSAEDGSLLWKRRASDTELAPMGRIIPGNERMISMWPIRTSLLVDEGNVYFTAGMFPTQGVYLFDLRAEDGSVQWKSQMDISPQGYLLASNERLYVPTGRTNPFIFARADGRVLGELPSAGGTFALLTENVLVTGPGRREKELDAADVDTKSKIAMFGGLRMLVNGPTAYMQSENRLSAFDRGRYLKLSKERMSLAEQQNKLKDQLRKLDKNSAEVMQLQSQVSTLTKRMNELSEQMKSCYRWTAPCQYPYAMIMAGNVLFVGGENEIAAIDAGSGKTLWTASVDGKAYGLSVVNGGLFVSTDRGRIHCFRHRANDSVKIVEAKTQTDPYPRDTMTKRYAQAAEAILKQTGITKGYCFVLDCGRGRLAYELARRSDLKIVGIEADASQVAAAREAIDKTGLYGRIVIHHGDSTTLPYTEYVANLIVSDETLRTGTLPAQAGDLHRILRPYGGVIAFISPSSKLNRQALKTWGQPSLADWKAQTESDMTLAWAERPALDGAGQWTQTYGEPGNSACSGDKLVKGDMAPQWFGKPGPRNMIDRHHRNVPPLFKDGRLFVPGDCVVYAVDAYNGTVEWKIEVPNSRRLGVFLDSSNIAVDEKFLYLAAEDKCFGFDVRTGRSDVTYAMPQLIESEPRSWGYLAYAGDILFGSGRRKDASYTETSYEADDILWNQNMQLVTSDYLFAVDKKTTGLLWKYRGGLIINTTISIGGGRIYFVETYSPKALADTLGRMPVKTLFAGGDQYLVALNAKTGEVVFKEKLDVTNFEEPVYLNYAKEVLLFSGSRLAEGIVHYYYRAFDARSGQVLWNADHGTDLNTDGEHGEYNRHPTIIEETVYAWPYAYELRTGNRIAGWEFDRRGHGCGGVSASAQCLFWRGSNPWMYDLGPNGGVLRLNKVNRPGCWINIIPAGGLVLIPEASSGCTCGYALQTSMAFVPKQTRVE